MVREFRRCFLIFSAVGLAAGTLALSILVRPGTGLAFGLTFALVAGDFLWMGFALGKLLGGGAAGKGAQALFYVGILLKTGLLLLALYGILKLLPNESLGVILGIGGPLVLLATAGALPARR